MLIYYIMSLRTDFQDKQTHSIFIQLKNIFENLFFLIFVAAEVVLARIRFELSILFSILSINYITEKKKSLLNPIKYLIHCIQ